MLMLLNVTIAISDERSLEFIHFKALNIVEIFSWLILNSLLLLTEDDELQLLVTINSYMRRLRLGLCCVWPRSIRERRQGNKKCSVTADFSYLADFFKFHLQLRIHPAGVKGALGVHVRLPGCGTLTAELQTGGTMIYRDESAAPVFCGGRPVLTHFAAAISRD